MRYYNFNAKRSNRLSRRFNKRPTPFHGGLLKWLTMGASLSLLALFFVALTHFATSAWLNRTVTAQETTHGQACPNCPPTTEQIIYAPIFDLPEAASSEINLNCRSPHPINVTPTFYTREGQAIVGEVIQLQPAEIRFLNTKSLIPAEYRHQQHWGGMSFSYLGRYREMWAQLTLHGIRNGGSANVLFSVLSDINANAQGAVWWMPQDGTVAIALGNSSNQDIHASLEFSGGEVEEVELAPFASQVIRRHADQRGGRSATRGRAESVIIRPRGSMDRLTATGVVYSADGKFTGMTRFYNLENPFQANLYATRFRVKDNVPHLLLRNTTGANLTVQPKFRSVSDQASDAVELPSITLGPNQVTELNLDPLLTAATHRSDLDEVSVQIVNSGAPGSLIGALYGTNQRTGTVYDVPLRDSGKLRESTGAYPIRLDGDYSTIISLTNASDAPTKFTAQINYEGGPYLLPIYHLSPGQTVVLDLRKLRDEQVPDWQGRTLPHSFTGGQFHWSIRGVNPTARVLGRAEIVSRREQVSSSYSCYMNCPDSFDRAYFPNGLIVGIGGLVAGVPVEIGYDCFSYPTGPYQVYDGTWTLSDTSIASVDASRDITGLAEGATGLTVEWDVANYDCNDDCRPGWQTTTSLTSGVQVNPTITLGTVTFTSPNPPVIRTGETATLSVVITASPGVPQNTPIGLQVSTSNVSGTVSITIDPANSTKNIGGGGSVSTSVAFPVSFTASSNPPQSVTLNGHVRLFRVTGTPADVSIGTGAAGEKDSSNQLTVQHVQ